MSDYDYLETCLTDDLQNVVLPRSLVRAIVEIAKTDDFTNRELPMHHQIVLNHVRELIGDVERDRLISYLHPFLFHGGTRRDDLNLNIHVEAMSLCNGYGQMNENEIRMKGLVWDWSHVRDSTVEALTECRALIEGSLQSTE